MSFSVLIVGLGQIGMGYDLNLEPDKYVYTHARAFNLHDDFKLIAGVDIDSDSRKQFTQVFDCPAYENIKSSLVNHKPDIIVIANPTSEHFNSVNEIIKSTTPKIILCEKPLSYDLDEAQKMVELCEIKGVSLYVNYMRRSDPGVIEIKKRLDCGEIKTPVKGVVWYSKGFYHNGSHFFNLLEYWLGPMKKSEVINRGRLWDNKDPEPDLHVNFENGSVVFLAAREEDFSYYAIELITPNGRLAYENGGQNIGWCKTEKDKLLQGYTSLSVSPDVIESGMDKYQLNVVEQLAKVLNGKKSELCSGNEAFYTLSSMNKTFTCDSLFN